MVGFIQKIFRADMLVMLGLILALGSQATFVGDFIAGISPSGTSGFGVLLIVIGAVLKIMAGVQNK